MFTTRTRLPHLVLILSLPFAAACGGDDLVGLEGDPLTEAEIQAVFNAFASAFSSLGAGQQAANAPARASVSVDQSFDVDAPCAGGGNIAAGGSVNGTVDDETFESDIRFELVFDPQSCAVGTEEGVLTIDGAPDVTFVVNSVFTETEISMSGSQLGGIRFTSEDGRSGTCPIDVTFETMVDLTDQSSTQNVTGTVCGLSASEFSVISATGA